MIIICALTLIAAEQAYAQGGWPVLNETITVNGQTSNRSIDEATLVNTARPGEHYLDFIAERTDIQARERFTVFIDTATPKRLLKSVEVDGVWTYTIEAVQNPNGFVKVTTGTGSETYTFDSPPSPPTAFVAKFDDIADLDEAVGLVTQAGYTQMYTPVPANTYCEGICDTLNEEPADCGSPNLPNTVAFECCQWGELLAHCNRHCNCNGDATCEAHAAALLAVGLVLCAEEFLPSIGE